MSELLDTDQVAEMTGLAVNTLRSWRWQGVGPRSFKVGRWVRYERSDVVAWLAAQKASTSAGGAPAA
ncbi:helix-turn-helix domain-containing protein [Candidatus Blastococcus massiliensis]|uniref:helix-turn-helix domain-containing protein n=1 Tax=Candidatus Blastococcus massiliensis TaxID=1470358 RepID=UPI0004B12E72|nr:helix-turn-helix domain-containing protein [Candidatus Blastococcus massiliensis]